MQEIKKTGQETGRQVNKLRITLGWQEKPLEQSNKLQTKREWETDTSYMYTSERVYDKHIKYICLFNIYSILHSSYVYTV